MDVDVAAAFAVVAGELYAARLGSAAGHRLRAGEGRPGSVLDANPGNALAIRASDTRRFMPMCSIAQHFGRPSTPTDQARIETLWGHIKREHPHPTTITDPQVLAAELERFRTHYNGVRLHEAIG